ncbi:uncharacterized protein C2845_PM15G01660 [Panicum miliaceum]|uniref:Retrotransposon gag domain-containing protein n=1 Tax=Panicum miliaceum TaxID=4540 RepID=A0A3L6QAK1_PANMI|nr:uncharacterized protein C2845_PM15G01660 [Panicum miliaceum]
MTSTPTTTLPLVLSALTIQQILQTPPALTQTGGHHVDASAFQPVDDTAGQPMSPQIQRAFQDTNFQVPNLMVQQPEIDWASKIADVMKNQFGLQPKETAFMYKKPYPEAYDQILLPHRYRLLDFTKFSGQDSMSTVEHISRFLVWCGEATATDALKIFLFPLSLSRLAFAWFASLPANSIITWADLEKQFHKYFLQEMKITDLTAVRQRNDELVPDYIQRFRDVRSRCFNLSLSDGQLAELTFQGLLPHIREKFSSQEFESLSHLAIKLANVDVRAHDTGKNMFQKNVNYVGDSSDSENEAEIGVAEWVKTKKLISCLFAKKEAESYGFDITKADRIFDLLLQEVSLSCPPIS